MALGKSKVAAAQDIVAQVNPAGGNDSDDVIGSDGGSGMKKFGQHVGGAAHSGQVMHSGERLQGNVGDHVHYTDQEASSG